MVLFDRSWYNRAGVERVMGFATESDVAEFMATVNGFEQALVRSGTIVIKYWLDIADEGPRRSGTVTAPGERPRRPTATGRIYETIFALLEQHPEGIRWSEFKAHVEASDPTLHPKTINGCVWRLVERYPGRVYKPAKGVFRLTRFREDR